jgi:hypothetical protein
MIRMRWMIAATLLTEVAPTSTLSAEDLSVPNLETKNSLAVNPSDFRQSDTAAAVQSARDDAPTVTDLESTRAALDRHAGPALSLSVGGWVSEQVTIAH